MKLRNLFILALGGILILPACKKTEATTKTPSLGGLSINEVAPFVAEGTKLSFDAEVRGLYTSDNSKPGTIGLFWQVNSADKDTLTTDIKVKNPTFEYSVDTLGSYTVTCYAYAGAAYYNASAARTFACIDPDTALTGLAEAKTVTIDGKQWTARNLYDTESGSAYKGATVVNTIFGKLYTWEEAKSACPSGWHLPSADEWDSLGSEAGPLMAPAMFRESRMWNPFLGQEITNTTGFNAIPIGYQDKTAGSNQFRRYGEYAAFWTSSDATSDSSLAQFRVMRYDLGEIQKGNGDKSSLALSVRCVKD